MIRARTFIVAIVAMLAVTILSPASAASASSTFYLVQTPSFPEYRVTFHGVIKPKVKNAVVKDVVTDETLRGAGSKH